MPDPTTPEGRARLDELVGAARDALAGVVREHRVTSEEWHALLAYLTEVGRRDEFTLLSDVLHLSVLVDQVDHAADERATASNVLGPFWVPDAPLLDSPARICREDEPGEPLVLTGNVRSVEGEPVGHAVLDVWQTAANRLYENQDPDQPELNLRGRVRVPADGRYEIHTVRPVPYEIPTDGPVGRFLAAFDRHAWRPAHLHVRVEADGYRPLTTMLFVAGDPWLEDDAIGAVKDSLVIPLVEDGGVLHGRFDFALAATAQ
jgi:catechol 1,2-dioxygenase